MENVELTRMYDCVDIQRTRKENMDQVRRISNRPGKVEMFALWILSGFRRAKWT